jgi:hypothetical protein
MSSSLMVSACWQQLFALLVKSNNAFCSRPYCGGYRLNTSRELLANNAVLSERTNDYRYSNTQH